MSNEANPVTFGPFTLDAMTERVTNAGSTVPLTRFEFKILAALVAAQGASMSRADLETVMYCGRERPGSNGLQVLVRRIRRKLGDKDAIVTVRGIGGYSMRADWFGRSNAA